MKSILITNSWLFIFVFLFVIRCVTIQYQERRLQKIWHQQIALFQQNREYDDQPADVVMEKDSIEDREINRSTPIVSKQKISDNSKEQSSRNKIGDHKINTFMPPKKTPIMDNVVLDINSASVDEWKNLRGIGDVLSERIVKYREALGGFYSIDQLKEVYGLSTETFAMIQENLKCNGSVLILDVDAMEFKALLKHPYLDYDQVRMLKNAMSKHRHISKEILESLEFFDEEAIKRILPYLDLSVEESSARAVASTIVVESL